jgi:hypothetical protein
MVLTQHFRQSLHLAAAAQAVAVILLQHNLLVDQAVQVVEEIVLQVQAVQELQVKVLQVVREMVQQVYQFNRVVVAVVQVLWEKMLQVVMVKLVVQVV